MKEKPVICPFPDINRVFFNEATSGLKYTVSPQGNNLMALKDEFKAKGEFISSIVAWKADPRKHLITLDVDHPVTVEARPNNIWRVTIQSPRIGGKTMSELLYRLYEDDLAMWKHAREYDDWEMYPLPPLDLRVEAVALPSSSPGHFHLYLKKEIEWEPYEKLLTTLRDACIIGQDFYCLCERNRMSILLRPGFTKKDLAKKYAKQTLLTED